MTQTEKVSESSNGLGKDSFTTVTLRDTVVEIVSDAGEGAQKAGVSFATVSAKMGNGIWTVEIIPADIQPPSRDPAGASGIRIRLGSKPVTNMGDKIDLIVAFNEQSLLGRIQQANFDPQCRIILESKWRVHPDPAIVASYTEVYEDLVEKGYHVHEVPVEELCSEHVSNPKLGKNMFVLGLLCEIYSRDIELARTQVAEIFRHKSQKIIDNNIVLLDAGYNWAADNLNFRFDVPGVKTKVDRIVTNGNEAIAMGVMASGMEMCAMYPITPATSASHFLSEHFEKVGGMVHQAEDEIAACAVAIGASYAGKCAVTITSGPGMSLKTELLGLAVMAEIPLVVVNVQRGGPSTGLPTKVEQGDLLASIFGTHGDAPKVVMAVATIEDCFYSMLTARKIAEAFRIPVVVLSDTNLATGQQPYERPSFSSDWVAPPIDQRPVPEGTKPYEWDDKTGLSKRIIPGQPGGTFTVTGLSHTSDGKVAYGPLENQKSTEYRSKKMAALQKTLKTPELFGGEEGDLLILGWGSTKGAIEEAVERLREDGQSVSSLHLRFLNPMASGIGDILRRFRRVITVEINYADEVDGDLITEENQRFSNLAWLLRARYLIDVKSFATVYGQPLRPIVIETRIRQELKKLEVNA